MYTNKELEEIYEKRYSKRDITQNKREISIYRKYRRILLPKHFLNESVNNLDLGCGRGHKTIGFSSMFKRVLAVDLSQNVIENCKELYGDSNIEFRACDATQIEEKFNLITAFGFSLFNTSNNDQFLKHYSDFYKNNSEKECRSFFIIGSFTDLSGNGKESWYLHTEQDLEYFSKHIKEKYQAKVRIVFPHKQINNYFGSGFYNFTAEVIKLVKKKNRTFFIVIEHG